MGLKSANECKMVLHNSAIVINDCDPSDFPTLLRQFGIWNKLCHRIEYIGIYYDKEHIPYSLLPTSFFWCYVYCIEL